MAEKFNQPPPYSVQNQNVYPEINQPYAAPPGHYPGYVPQAQGQAPTHTQTIIINKEVFGPFPARTSCPICKNDIVTQTYSHAGLLAWLLGAACCFVGCWAGCCLIPCCIDATRDVVHKCPNCNTDIALYKRL